MFLNSNYVFYFIVGVDYGMYDVCITTTNEWQVLPKAHFTLKQVLIPNPLIGTELVCQLVHV